MAHEAPTPTPGSRAEVRQDARSRGWRTALQGLAAAVLVAVAAVVADTVTPGEVIDWATLGAAVGTAALTAVAAWASRPHASAPVPPSRWDGGAFCRVQAQTAVVTPRASRSSRSARRASRYRCPALRSCSLTREKPWVS